jgi:hypothetical protein
MTSAWAIVLSLLAVLARSPEHLAGSVLKVANE